MANAAGLSGWIVIVGVGLLTRLLVAMTCTPAAGLHHMEPTVIADSLNAGQGFVFEQYGTTYRAWKEPLYIALLAGLRRLVGANDVAVVMVQAGVGILVALGMAGIARGLFGDARRALIVGILVAVNPFLVYYDTQFAHPLSFDMLLFVALIGSIVGAWARTPNPWRRVVAGIAAGVVLWQRATLITAGLGMWVAACWRTPVARRRSVGLQALVWLGIAGALISPWLIRNYRLTGRALITTDAAHVLWLGNNPWSNGTYTDLEGRRVFYLADEAFQRKVQGAPELQQYELFLNETTRFIREHPWAFVTLVARKLAAFFWFPSTAGLAYTTWQNLLYRLAYAGLLSLGLSGLVLFWRRATEEQRSTAVVVLASIPGLAAAHAMTAVNLKHRVPWELVLALFAAESVVRIRAFVTSRWRVGLAQGSSGMGARPEAVVERR